MYVIAGLDLMRVVSSKKKKNWGHFWNSFGEYTNSLHLSYRSVMESDKTAGCIEMHSRETQEASEQLFQGTTGMSEGKQPPGDN